ncbi:hypothetical protein [Pantoea ananatis]|uniref:transcriptional antitermination N peptide n=1 Tax=Pantoea ananas TaxID=553 RepID=UPI001B315C87|nr:hypothetical protein [Pantoea ananatis]
MKARELRKRLRAEAHREQLDYAGRIDRAFKKLSTGCSLTVSRAINSPSLREKKTAGSACLQEVAIYSAGFRNGRKDATHIIKG